MVMEEYIDCENAPPYVTLSHRWCSHELTFESFQETFQETSEETFQDSFSGQIRSEYLAYVRGKVVGFCEAIRLHSAHILQLQSEMPYPWSSVPCHAWVDTCCIDKRSSSELSEAINSMYKWYERANYCFTYLADVDVAEDCPDTLVSKLIAQSEWFDRGWTLQELLASQLVLFFDQSWNLVAYKGLSTTRLPNDYLGAAININKHIAERCKIRIKILENHHNIDFASVAEKFSWAARRKTTRREDMAYCLLGLFKINMPLLYGEGDKAFRRLQQEIIASTDDETLYAWRCYQPSIPSSGLLAESPAAFCLSGSLVTSSMASTTTSPESSSEFVATPKGLKIMAKAVRIWTADHDEHWLVPLECNDIATTDHYETLLNTDVDSNECDYGDHEGHKATLTRLVCFRRHWKDGLFEDSKPWPVQALVLTHLYYNFYGRSDIREIAPIVLSDDDPDVEYKTFFVQL